MLCNPLEALQAREQCGDPVVVAIKVYILQKFPTVDTIWLKCLLKWALDTDMQSSLLVRPTNSKVKGATGSFKSVPKHTQKIQPRKMPTMSDPQGPAEAPKKSGPRTER